jgi:hypothetical protein
MGFGLLKAGDLLIYRKYIPIFADCFSRLIKGGNN